MLRKLFKWKKSDSETADPDLKAEMEALKSYIGAKTNNEWNVRFSPDGKIDSVQLLDDLHANWLHAHDVNQVKPETAGYSSASYHKYMQIDVPLDDAIRTTCPRLIGNAENLKELIDPAVRAYLGRVAYQWMEDNSPVNATLCQEAMANFT